jgi:phytoene dehydrogenase-like protein
VRILPASDTYPFFPKGRIWEGPPLLTEQRTAKSRYRPPSKLIDQPDAIIIGSGIGGLGLASMLAQRKGMRVLVLEANSVPGGCMHMHEFDGFEFNAGIDSVGDMDPGVGRGINRATADFVTQGSLKWAKMADVHEICTFGDEEYKWYSSPEANIEWIERMFPGEGNVRGYYDLESAIERATPGFAVTKLMPGWVPQAVTEAAFRVSGGAWRKYMAKGANVVFQKDLGFSERLTSVFCYMYGNHGVLPGDLPFATHAITMYHYRNGAYYPAGGPGQIVESIIPIVERAGGQVAVGTPADKIIIENGRAVGVKLENGEEVRAPIVVSDASAYTTFTELMDRELATKLGYLEHLGKTRPSPAHAHLMLGFDERVELPQHIIWALPTYPSVGKYDLDAGDKIWKTERRTDGGPSAYILCPSERDPVFQQRYPNKSTVCVLAEMPIEWVQRHRTDPAFKAELEGKLTESLMRIARQHLPGIRGKTPKVMDLGIPVGCNPRGQGGCSYGLECNAQRLVDDVHWLRHKTKVPGLYLSGQDPFVPSFAGALISARIAYSVITGDLLFMLG